MSDDGSDNKGGVFPPFDPKVGLIPFAPGDRPDPSIAERHRRRDAIDDIDDMDAADRKMANDLQMPTLPEHQEEWWQNLSPEQRFEWEDANRLWTRAFHNWRDLKMAQAVRAGGRKSQRLLGVEKLTRDEVCRDLLRQPGVKRTPEEAATAYFEIHRVVELEDGRSCVVVLDSGKIYETPDPREGEGLEPEAGLPDPITVDTWRKNYFAPTWNKLSGLSHKDLENLHSDE